MYVSLLSVVIGGALGSACRWLISLKLNDVFPDLPLGTLLVNIAGGFVIGAVSAAVLKLPTLDPAWRLLVVSGFCGGFTTFSTFSAEVVSMLQTGKVGWATATVLAHVAGSLLATFAGYALVTRVG